MRKGEALLLALASVFMVGGTLTEPLPTRDDLAFVKYLRQVYHNQRNIPVVTTDPNGSRLGRYGDLVIFADSGWARMCKNDTTTSGGGTSWDCDPISPTAIVFEGATEDEFETTVSVADPTADNTITIPDDDVNLTSTAPGFTFDTSNTAGTADTMIRSDSTIALFDATVPVTQSYGDSAATGSESVAARRDHTHGMFAAPDVQIAALSAQQEVGSGEEDLSGMSVTVTATGRPVLIFFRVAHRDSSARHAFVQIQMDGSDIGTLFYESTTDTGNTNNQPDSVVSGFFTNTPSSGSRTYKLRGGDADGVTWTAEPYGSYIMVIAL